MVVLEEEAALVMRGSGIFLANGWDGGLGC
jgi:hypothetical protein